MPLEEKENKRKILCLLKLNCSVDDSRREILINYKKNFQTIEAFNKEIAFLGKIVCSLLIDIFRLGLADNPARSI